MTEKPLLTGESVADLLSRAGLARIEDARTWHRDRLVGVVLAVLFAFPQDDAAIDAARRLLSYVRLPDVPAREAVRVADLSEAEVAAIAEARITEGAPYDLADVPWLLAAQRIAEATGAVSVWRDRDGDGDWDVAVILPDDVDPGRWTPVTLWKVIADLQVGTRVVAMRQSTYEAERNVVNAVASDVARNGTRIA